MGLLAFRLQVNLDFGSFNPGHPRIPEEAHKGRERARTMILKHFGGDPLDWQAQPLKVGEKEIVMMWRLNGNAVQLEELKGIVRRYIFLLPNGLFPIVDWELKYHTCGNGNGKPCSRWQILDEGVGIPSPSTFKSGG